MSSLQLLVGFAWFALDSKFSASVRLAQIFLSFVAIYSIPRRGFMILARLAVGFHVRGHSVFRTSLERVKLTRTFMKFTEFALFLWRNHAFMPPNSIILVLNTPQMVITTRRGTKGRFFRRGTPTPTAECTRGRKRDLWHR